MRTATWILVLVVLSVVLFLPTLGQSDTLPFPHSAHADDGTPEMTPSANPFAGDTRWIVYQTNRSGNDATWLMHLDGSNNHQIATDFNGTFVLPNWSPDGTKIVMVARNSGDDEPLYEYDLTTDTYKKLFPCPDLCFTDEPVYSPDGTKIAFIRYFGPLIQNSDVGGEVPADCSLWVGDLNTLQLTRITSNMNDGCNREYFPRWSPDGKQLTYWRDPYSNGQPTGTAVYTINADGTNEQRLTDPAMFAGDPDWSPDGEWIVFTTYPLSEFESGDRVSNLYRMHPDGTAMEQLTNYETSELRATQPRYTSDGMWILFTAVTPSSRNLWVMPADGGDVVTQLTSAGIYTHGSLEPQPQGN